MEQATFEHMCKQVDETARRATQAASALTDALENGVHAVRRAAKQGSQAATEFIYDTKKRIQRSPFETIAVTFAAGIIAGSAITLIAKRR
jgi:ElaB/YqjD/DUF883 family membrane-anchored ribosome-binding protein